MDEQRELSIDEIGPAETAAPVETTRFWLFMAMGVGALGAVLLTLLLVL